MKLEDLEKQLEDLYIKIGSCNHSSEIQDCWIDQASELEDQIAHIKCPVITPLELAEGQCPYCFSKMKWCEGCRMYSCHGCDPYGTCMCN